MYYKSLLQLIKEKHECVNRFSITKETFVNNINIVELYLSPCEKYICPICGSDSTCLNGKKTRTLKDELYANYKTFVKIVSHRILCKNCGKMFVDSVPELLKKTKISLNLKLNILIDLKDDVSFKYVANKRNVSVQTVIDIFTANINIDRIPFEDVLCIDEFKNLRSAKGKYAFVMYDPNRHTICDILEDRQQNRIDKYLYNIPQDEKKRVKYVISDMNLSYRSIIRRHFPLATHIVDTFHYLRYVVDAFNDVRISVQNSFPKKSAEYKILKKYWKILSSYQNDLNIEDSAYNHLQRKRTSISQIIMDSLYLSSKLENAYLILQNFLYGVSYTKFEDAETWLDGWLNEITESNIKEYKDLKKMFLNWKNEIINSFIRFGNSKLHNGYLEGINNHIKEIKRIGYGYRNFNHFRNRLMYVINCSEEMIIKQINKKK